MRGVGLIVAICICWFAAIGFVWCCFEIAQAIW